MTLNVTVKKRITTYVSGQDIPVCGNTGDQVNFTFDEEWSQHETKTARFKWGGKVFDQEFTGNICEIPNIDNTDSITVGVFVGEEENGEDELSTTDTRIPYKRSTRCGNHVPHNDSGKNYTNEAKGAAAEAKEAAAEAKEAAAEAAKSEANLAYNSMRIERIEDKIGLDGDLVKIESGYKNDTYFEENMYRYIRILKLGSNGSFSPDEERNTVYTTASYIRSISGVNVTPSNLSKCPEYGIGNCDNERYSNYIFFENGKAYYHQGCRSVSDTKITYSDLAEGEVILEEERIDYGAYIIGLAEPIITDISAVIDFDGVIDLGELYNNYGEQGDYGEGSVYFDGDGYVEFAYMTKEGA